MLSHFWLTSDPLGVIGEVVPNSRDTLDRGIGTRMLFGSWENLDYGRGFFFGMDFENLIRGNI